MVWSRSLLIRGHSAPVYACTFLNGLLYTTAGDRFVVAWNIETGHQEPFTLKLETPAYCLANIPEKNWLLIGCANGNCIVVDTLSRRLVHEHNFFGHALFSITHYPEQEWIIAGDAEGNLLLIGYEGKLIASFPLNCGKIRQLVVSNNELFVACQDGSWRSFELPLLNETRKLEAHDKGVNTLICESTGNTLVSGGKDGHIRIWDLLTNRQIHAFPAHYQTIYGILGLPNGYVSVSMDKTIKIWNRDWQIVQRIDHKNNGHLRSVNGCVSIDENRFVTFSDDRTIAIWSTEN